LLTVHTKKEFIFENFRLNYYNLGVNTNNEIHHTTKYADHEMNYRILKEFSECSADEKAEIFRVLDIVEKLMLSYFNADKINIASSHYIFLFVCLITSHHHRREIDIFVQRHVDKFPSFALV
jgi:hypothetical protein